MPRSVPLTLAFAILSLPACAKDDGAGGSTDASGEAGADGGSGSGSSSSGGSQSSGTSGSATMTGESSGSDGGATTGTTTGGSGTATGPGSSGSSGGEDTGDAGTGMSFVVKPDGTDRGNECDVWTQDCADGDKCMPWANDGGTAWNATTCTPLDPNPKEIGDTCTVTGSALAGVDDCKLGAMCWNTDAMGVGTCVAFCTGSPAAPMCENPDDSCLITNDGVLILCLPVCDPILQDCGAMQGCYLVDGVQITCGPDSSGTTGEYLTPCEFDNSCDPGLFCALGDAVPGCTGARGCCTEWCDLEAADPAAGCSGLDQGVQCVPFFEDGSAPPGLGHVGMCVLPT